MKRLSINLFLGAVVLLFIGAKPMDNVRASTADTPNVLFFVYDAGETLGLLPVTRLLASEKIDVRWVPLTPWALRIIEQETQSFVPPPANVSTLAHVNDRQASGDITYWSNFIADNKPDLVVLGLVSSIQAQLAQELKKRGVHTVGFYDAFDTTSRDSIVWRVANEVDEVWVPTNKIMRNLNQLGLSNVKVMGQPSLESWIRIESELKPNDLYDKLRIPSGKKILVFAGQYGEGYAEILEAFLRVAIEEVKKREDLYLVLSPHPKTNGEVELASIQKYDQPRVLVMPRGVSTAELAAISVGVITWRSTVGIQAAFLGKPVIYFNFNVGDYSNDLIEQGIAQATTPKTLGAALRTILVQSNSASSNRKRLSKLGYVMNSSRKIATELTRLAHKYRSKE